MQLFVLRMDQWQEHPEQSSVSYLVGVYTSLRKASEAVDPWKYKSGNYDFYETIIPLELDKIQK